MNDEMQTYCDNLYYEGQEELINGNFLNLMVKLESGDTVSVVSTSDKTYIDCSNTFIFTLIKL